MENETPAQAGVSFSGGRGQRDPLTHVLRQSKTDSTLPEGRR